MKLILVVLLQYSCHALSLYLLKNYSTKGVCKKLSKLFFKILNDCTWTSSISHAIQQSEWIFTQAIRFVNTCLKIFYCTQTLNLKHFGKLLMKLGLYQMFEISSNNRRFIKQTSRALRVNQDFPPYPVGNYMFKVCIRNKIIITTPERRQWHRSGIFVNFEHISHLFFHTCSSVSIDNFE